jgi:hypothetical protein
MNDQPTKPSRPLVSLSVRAMIRSLEVFPAELQSHAYEIAIGMANLRGGGSNLTRDLSSVW